MSDTNYRVEPDRITIYPHWGTGWLTVFHQIRQQITMQFCILWFKLPLRRKVPYSQIEKVSSYCWSSASAGGGGWLAILLLRMGSPRARREMPTKGWRYDILMTVKGGETIKIGTDDSLDVADEIERECRRRLGLSGK